MDSFDDQQMFSPKNSGKSKQNLDQPATHKNNKTCMESLLCCKTFDNDLSQSQLKLFYLIKSFANILYEDSNLSHQKILKELYQTAFGQELINSEDLSSDQWMTLGFQNRNAQTDFRGAGLIGLNNLLVFAKNQKKIMEEMCVKNNEFLFAMTSLNITYFLKIFFHLADFLNYKKDKKVICSRTSLKNFTLLLENAFRTNPCKDIVLEDYLKNIFYEIHEILLIHCFKQWLRFKENKKEGASLMDFYHIFEAVKINMKEFFDEDGHCTLVLLREYFQNVLTHLK